MIVGTRAQLIKMAPVFRELERRDSAYRLVFTGQHTVTMEALLADFGVVTRPEYMYSGPEVSGIARMLFWMPKILFRMLRRRRTLFRNELNRPPTVVVHGDTFSTLLGALAGKLTGCRVAHIESGLRSFNVWNPFPEELTRKLVFRLTDLAFCPGEWASGNMARYNVETVDTGQNTLLDTLRLALADDEPADKTEFKRYCVASVHRFENIFVRQRIEWVAEALERVAEELDVVFVLHPATEKRLRVTGLFLRLCSNPRIHFRERMPYTAFIRLLQASVFVLTDGGSNQEELYYMQKPTLILRNATERREGIGERAVLCGFEQDVVDGFLEKVWREGRGEDILASDIHPSPRIVDRLLRDGRGAEQA
ncbi:UDP-N-acetylglucosamine 2-epimerase [Arhodomonas sp. SL1]|uniref:UDP-N-acetylglucosamine 2-epimerase n=1 Tax=Arhodomonas sp. SL1 TaxID=3425691 RepID=UPI003F881C95